MGQASRQNDRSSAAASAPLSGQGERNSSELAMSVESLIVDKDKQTSEDLRDKIKSKMEVAKFFSGFLALLLALSIRDLNTLIEGTSGSEPFSKEIYFVWAGVVLIFSSLTFSVATLFAYDRLLMPKALWEDWKDHKGNHDLHYKANMVLKRRMAMAWRYLFIPGVASFFAGVATLITAIFPWDKVELSIGALTTVSVLSILVVIVLPIGAYFRVRTSFRFDTHQQKVECKWIKEISNVFRGRDKESKLR